MTPASPNGEPLNGQHPTTRPEPAATAAPSREARAQTPKEALGATVGSGLFMASLQAGGAFALLLAALTFGPYYWEKSHANATPAPAEKEKTAPAQNQTPVAPPPSSPDPSKLPPGTTAGGKASKKDDIVDKLGENGTKTAPAKVNPLDKKDDDILKDIK